MGTTGGSATLITPTPVEEVSITSELRWYREPDGSQRLQQAYKVTRYEGNSAVGSRIEWKDIPVIVNETAPR